jgi:hypothetical protein
VVCLPGDEINVISSTTTLASSGVHKLAVIARTSPPELNGTVCHLIEPSTVMAFSTELNRMARFSVLCPLFSARRSHPSVGLMRVRRPIL